MRDAQADVPSADGFGRNLRSKTRWFTGFCNSHQVSHFATFFIDARAEISVAESRLCFREAQVPPRAPRTGRGGQAFDLVFLGAFRAGVRWSPGTHASARAGDGREPRGRRPEHPGRAAPRCLNRFAGRSALQVSTMILPQVHLRKPCYDFSFL